ncbi:MAG: sugar phosphate isomerase/epimerase, partial [Planctomycetia bacterium]|nr:sugar phosphate isomerase/epimerase [Planctomycetia bacterium]
MYVACSTQCFTREPFESALRHIAELEFDKIELAIVEGGTHLRPTEVAANPDAAAHRLRNGPSLTPAAIALDFGDPDPEAPALRKRFEAMCRLAKPLTVAVLT